MNGTTIVRAIALAVTAVGLGACENGGSAFSGRAQIAEAQAKSAKGANPAWLQVTDKPELFKRVRDRAYHYCLSGEGLNARCASEQDIAVEGSIMALNVVAAQSQMKDKDRLGLKERHVASDPMIAPRVENTCWALYKEHGAADARILSVCLGNLTDFSPLIPLPVP